MLNPKTFNLAVLSILCSTQATCLSPAPSQFRIPASDAVDHVNPMIGNGGDSPNGSGGMIPSTGPPFAMTRWVAQTRENYVSVTPYNQTDTSIHGFQGTHQPAIWMGESGQVIVTPSLSDGLPKVSFEERGLKFDKSSEISTPSYYSVDLHQNGVERPFKAEQSSSSRVGHLRFTFGDFGDLSPSFVIEATRAYVLGSDDPRNLSYPIGDVYIDFERREVSGRNPERQDHIIGPNRATSFAGYFVARFDSQFESYGTASNGAIFPGEEMRSDSQLSAYVTLPKQSRVVNIRIGVSFISIEQARRNLDNEIPDGQSLEATAKDTRTLWAEKLDLISVQGGSEADKTVFYTAFFHTLHYPYEQSEEGRYYSGYDETIHSGTSYSGYSIWDIYRAEWTWLILFAPERVGDMVTSMLQDYREGGWLPMWKNIVETNIMVIRFSLSHKI